MHKNRWHNSETGQITIEGLNTRNRRKFHALDVLIQSTQQSSPATRNVDDANACPHFQHQAETHIDVLNYGLERFSRFSRRVRCLRPAEQRNTDDVLYHSNNPSNLHPSTQTSVPSLVNIPLEIKQQIISYLSPIFYPTLSILRRTHTSFYHLISANDIRTKSTPRMLKSQLSIMESRYRHLLPPNTLACYTCMEFLPWIFFVNDERYATSAALTDRRRCIPCQPEVYDIRWTGNVKWFKGTSHGWEVFRCKVCGRILLNCNGGRARAECTGHSSENWRARRHQLIG